MTVICFLFSHISLPLEARIWNVGAGIVGDIKATAVIKATYLTCRCKKWEEVRRRAYAKGGGEREEKKIGSSLHVLNNHTMEALSPLLNLTSVQRFIWKTIRIFKNLKLKISYALISCSTIGSVIPSGTWRFTFLFMSPKLGGQGPVSHPVVSTDQ